MQLTGSLLSLAYASHYRQPPTTTQDHPGPNRHRTPDPGARQPTGSPNTYLTPSRSSTSESCPSGPVVMSTVPKCISNGSALRSELRAYSRSSAKPRLSASNNAHEWFATSDANRSSKPWSRSHLAPSSVWRPGYCDVRRVPPQVSPFGN